MISLMNSDCEVDRKLDVIKDSEDVKSGIAGGGLDCSKDEDDSSLKISDEARVSSMELDSVAREAEAGPRVSEIGRLEEVRVDGEISKEVESEGSDVKVENLGTDGTEARDEEIEEQKDGFEAEDDHKEPVEKGTGSQYNSLLSEFDDFVANEKSGQVAATIALRYGFEVGDMVWGKVKSHPWWPGHIFNDSFASPQVRRTRRDGHVLVAFFGDSSYGWFDPAELIPFEFYFPEKSHQTSSRTFVKACEEAVDELSRRRGLALTCKCRNPYNFRATNVKGYFVVDVPDYEPRGVYSVDQIRKARDDFNPSETLSFIKQLALSPSIDNDKDLDFVKSKATVCSYRKGVFEEFDETYAQAFGVRSGRPSRSPVDLHDQPVKEPPLAPLSGPLVIAETLGGGTSATKLTKAKIQSKKDRYLFKRREESSSPKGHQTNQGQASPSIPSGNTEASIAAGDGEYALLKRTSEEETGVTSSTGRVDQASASKSLATQDGSVETKQSLDKGKGALEEVKEGSQSVSDGEGLNESKHEENAKMSRPREDFQQSTSGSLRSDQIQDGRSVGELPPIVAKLSRMSTVGGVKKVKARKRPAKELNSEKSMTEEKQKKKKKKHLGSETNFRDPQKKPSVPKKVGPLVGKSVGKSTQIVLARNEDSSEEQFKKNVALGNNLSDSVETLPMVGITNVEVELPRLLSDLQALALDPFHCAERNSPVIVRKFFLGFRSLVYQKSLFLSPPSETETVEVNPSKSLIGVGASEKNSNEHVRDLSSSKSAKPSFRSDDPTISGRKRAPSDRQEEIASKRSKKISDIKTLAAEKKTSQKTPEPQRGVDTRDSARDSAVPLIRRSIKPARKLEAPSKSVEPTMLVMRFPPQTNLPSPAELKARFARFGPMDQAGLRVFWKSSTCRIVFLHKSDAQAACKYALANTTLFGNINVKYYTKEVGAPAHDFPESGKNQADESPNDNFRAKDPPLLPRPSSSLTQQPHPQPTTQLRSILKKPPGEDSRQGSNNGGGSSSTKGTSRVKFMLGGEESTTSRVNSNNSGSFADGVGPPPSVAMEYSIRNFQKVVPPSPSPILPLPPQFAKNPLNNLHHPEIAPRNTHNLNTSGANLPPPPPPTIDISQQMLSLLTRCNDIVSNVTTMLGYVPYHPL
ncbi:hypothetical protein UlMin_029210 [Ulmus minor]